MCSVSQKIAQKFDFECTDAAAEMVLAEVFSRKLVAELQTACPASDLSSSHACLDATVRVECTIDGKAEPEELHLSWADGSVSLRPTGDNLPQLELLLVGTNVFYRETSAGK